MGDSAIEWTDVTWNPVRGCSKVSPGCANCYAERTAARGAHGAYAGLVRIGEGSPRWTGEVRLIVDKLHEPLGWKKAQRVFVNSMSDLFHEKLTDHEIGRVFTVMSSARKQTFQVLTKRAQRLHEFTNVIADRASRPAMMPVYPLPNVWLGVSVENQDAANERIPLLLKSPAAVRFLSVEPMLERVDLMFAAFDGAESFSAMGGINWVIVGGESGPGARPCAIEWIRDVVNQCRTAGVPCFVKQLGAKPTWMGTALCDADGHALASRKGGDMDEWPVDLRVREFPQ